MKIFLYFQYHHNKAWRRGGAVYAELSGPSIDHSIVMALKFDKCFIQFDGMRETSSGTPERSFNGNVTFVNNDADINGDSIFVTSLTACNSSSSGRKENSVWNMQN